MDRPAPWARVAWFCLGLVASSWIALAIEHCPALLHPAPPPSCISVDAATEHDPDDAPPLWTLYLRSGRADAVVALHDGALELTHVAPDGKLHRIGLRSGDVILAIDGAPIASIPDLHHRIGQAFAARSIELDLVRDGRRFRFTTDLRNPVLLRP